MAKVVNYHDAVVYDTDVVLFGEHGWLNDNCINWFFRFLEFDVFPGRGDLLFMDPAVVSCMMLQCDEPDEFVELGRGIDLERRNTVFVPINDASGRLSRGTHWSLLVFHRQRGEHESMSFRHYDSSRGHNQEPAERTAAKFWRLFDGTGAGDPPYVEHVSDAPQQQNGYDCGMYTILLAEHIASEKNGASHAEPAGNRCTTTVSPTRPPTKTTTTRTCPEGRAGSGTSEGDEGEGKIERVLLSGGDRDDGRGGRFGGFSAEFVSNARKLARERLVKHFRDGSG